MTGTFFLKSMQKMRKVILKMAIALFDVQFFEYNHIAKCHDSDEILAAISK
jgi:hypothetical protein